MCSIALKTSVSQTNVPKFGSTTSKIPVQNASLFAFGHGLRMNRSINLMDLWTIVYNATKISLDRTLNIFRDEPDETRVSLVPFIGHQKQFTIWHIATGMVICLSKKRKKVYSSLKWEKHLIQNKHRYTKVRKLILYQSLSYSTILHVILTASQYCGSLGLKNDFVYVADKLWHTASKVYPIHWTKLYLIIWEYEKLRKSWEFWKFCIKKIANQ